jgi:aldehyde dehydrogenase (NAD+)
MTMCCSLYLVDGLPFGGIGPSGCKFVPVEHINPDRILLAGYHTRKFTFDMFTHLRASLDSPGLFVVYFSLLPTYSLFAPCRIDSILGGRFPPYTVSFDDLFSPAAPNVCVQAKNESFLTNSLGIKLPPRPRLSANGHVSSRNVRRARTWLIEQGQKALIERKSNTKWLFLLVSLAIVGIGYTRAADVSEWTRWLKRLIQN